MRVAVVMPKTSFEMESGQIYGWVKKVGDSVTAGEAIATIETEKTNIDLEAPATGRLVEILHGAGSNAPVDGPIGYIETDE
jgi:pyruvate/2-oxoglutarate dehydrogenase complex dihydrolipoamide acyltransferase (E2) component